MYKQILRKTSHNFIRAQPRRWKHFLLQYKYVENILKKRTPYRPDHLDLVLKLNKQGKILLAGAHLDPTDGAAFIFNVDKKSEVEKFVEQDPYYLNSLVPNYTIKELAVVTE
eukprot:snap_masked-scaffold_11-processed-gene-8.10-mRNA-1 protein AED:0.03 eAED:0.03 QI:0/-1/0/1/-1/1/1/0/111